MEVPVTKRRIESDGAPPALSVYSQAIEANGFVFCAGQLGLDPVSGQLVEGGISAQTERALRNLGAVLDAAGLSYPDVVKTTCFLADIADFAAFNEVYARFFSDAPPARSTFAVAALPKDGSVEVEAIAAVREV
jgi:2-iminobutanoate/2-iminopropanoate deaminase